MMHIHSHFILQVLRLSQRALGETASGKVVNLLANDVSRFDMMTLLVNSLWTAPLLTIIVTILLWQEIGIAGIVGIVVILIVVLIQSKFDDFIVKWQWK